MRRGTTPTLTFTTPYTAAAIAYGFITFQQGGNIVFDLPLSDSAISVVDNAVSAILTQEQTLKFAAEADCQAQIRAVLISGKAVASNIIRIPIDIILKDGEI